MLHSAAHSSNMDLAAYYNTVFYQSSPLELNQYSHVYQSALGANQQQMCPSAPSLLSPAYSETQTCLPSANSTHSYNYQSPVPAPSTSSQSVLSPVYSEAVYSGPGAHSPTSDYSSNPGSPRNHQPDSDACINTSFNPVDHQSVDPSYHEAGESHGMKVKGGKKTRQGRLPYIPALEILQKRRLAANARERKRMNKINSAFERLKQVLPGQMESNELSKFESLQVAQNYIMHLATLLNYNIH